MYDFPDCKYTYFSLIDKSLGHLFHLPASIRTKTHLKCPLSKTPPQFARFPATKTPPRSSTSKNLPPKQTHSHHATPSRDTIMTRNHDTPSRNTIMPSNHAQSHRPQKNAPQKHQTKITPYNVSSRALAAILSPSLSVYFTSIGRYFFSSFTLPEDLAMRTRFLIAVRSSDLIFNTLL